MFGRRLSERAADSGHVTVVETPSRGLSSGDYNAASAVSANQDADGTHVDIDMLMSVQRGDANRRRLGASDDFDEEESVHAQGSFAVEKSFDEAKFGEIAGRNTSGKLGHFVATVIQDAVNVDMSFPSGAKNLTLTADYDDTSVGNGRRLGRKSRRRVTGRSKYTVSTSSRRVFGRVD